MKGARGRGREEWKEKEKMEGSRRGRKWGKGGFAQLPSDSNKLVRTDLIQGHWFTSVQWLSLKYTSCCRSRVMFYWS